MKAIILAAGKGTRLGKYTKDLPKGMLTFNEKSLIERQIETLKSCGINDISIVTGYMKEKIKIPSAKYYHNKDYENTNMVASLFCAESEMNSEGLVCYSDILYEKRVLEEVLKTDLDIGVAVDEDYLDYWQARLDNWKDDLETMQINSQGFITELGTPTKSIENAKERYVGILKFSKKGFEILKQIFYENKRIYWDSENKWLNSKSFKKAYMTDILQCIINKGYNVNAIKIKRGWMEFDTEEDYEKAVIWEKSGKIKNQINL